MCFLAPATTTMGLPGRRSSSSCNGITRCSSQQCSFPGFLCTETDDAFCKWVYLGEYRPIPAMDQTGDRVLPFFFRLPDKARFIPAIEALDLDSGMRVLSDHCLRIGWQL